MRQRPIFPYRHQYSIFGASELNFCVRYEYRWILTAIITAMVYIVSLNTGISILFSVESLLHRKYITFIFSCQLIFLYSALAKSSFRQGSISILLHLSFIKRSSPRPISIGQLNTLLHLHLRPINLVVFKGSYYLTIWDILS